MYHKAQTPHRIPTGRGAQRATSISAIGNSSRKTIAARLPEAILAAPTAPFCNAGFIAAWMRNIESMIHASRRRAANYLRTPRSGRARRY
jgi:hypothetical protein